MNPFLLALPGLLVGIGLALLVLMYAPRTVRAGDALARLGQVAVIAPTKAAPLSRWDRAGSWLAQHIPQVKFLGPPARDLELLEIPVSRFYARKIQLALFGLFAPVVLSLFLQLLVRQPVTLPLLASPFAGFIMWMATDSQVRAKATDARREFTRFVSVYLKLVAVALLGNSTADSALSNAATVSDTWVFQRIRREYAQAEITRTSKWDAIERLGEQVQIESLSELGRMMRLSEARVGLRDQLIAADAKLRKLVDAADKAAAAKATRRTHTPVFMTLIPIISLVMLPAVFSFFSL